MMATISHHDSSFFLSSCQGKQSGCITAFLKYHKSELSVASEISKRMEHNARVLERNSRITPCHTRDVRNVLTKRIVLLLETCRLISHAELWSLTDS